MFISKPWIRRTSGLVSCMALQAKPAGTTFPAGTFVTSVSFQKTPVAGQPIPASVVLGCTSNPLASASSLLLFKITGELAVAVESAAAIVAPEVGNLTITLNTVGENPLLIEVVLVDDV